MMELELIFDLERSNGNIGWIDETEPKDTEYISISIDVEQN